jgi:hypothetical protein
MNTIVAYIIAGMIILAGVIAIVGIVDAFIQIRKMDNDNNQKQ